MRLLCLCCGNRRYFDVDIESLKQLNSDTEGLIIENARFEDFDFTEDGLRDNLQNQVDYILNQTSSQMLFDSATESYYSAIEVLCAKCGSRRIAIPSKTFKKLSLEQELEQNREEFQNIRKERKNHENNLPVLWQP